MLSYNGFKMNLDNVQHYTNLFHAHKTDGFLNVVEQSKQVLEQNFIEQEKEVEKTQELIYKMNQDLKRLYRYEKALKEIAEGVGDYYQDEQAQIAISALNY